MLCISTTGCGPDKQVRAWTYLKWFLLADEVDFPTLHSFQQSPSALPAALAERYPEYVRWYLPGHMRPGPSFSGQTEWWLNRRNPGTRSWEKKLWQKLLDDEFG